MRNTFKRLGQRVRGSAFMIPLGLFLFLASIALLVLNIRDWYTSYLGIDLIPVYHAYSDTSVATDSLHYYIYSWSRLAISLLPQLFTVIGTYTVIALDPQNDEEKKLRVFAGGVTLIAMMFDIATGYQYYVPLDLRGTSFFAALQEGGSVLNQHLWALFMAGGIDTIFSEVAGAWVWGMSMELFGDFIKQLDRFIVNVGNPRGKSKQRKQQGQQRGNSGNRSNQSGNNQPRREQGTQMQRQPRDLHDAVQGEGVRYGRPNG